MTEPVIITLITTLGTVLVALIGKIAVDTSKTKKHAEQAKTAAQKTEHSINNRPTPLSDRIDGLAGQIQATSESVSAVAKDLRRLRDEQALTRGDVLGLRDVDASNHRETQQLRKDFQHHVEETRPLVESIQALHSRYIGNKPKD